MTSLPTYHNDGTRDKRSYGTPRTIYSGQGKGRLCRKYLKFVMLCLIALLMVKNITTLLQLSTIDLQEEALVTEKLRYEMSIDKQDEINVDNHGVLSNPTRTSTASKISLKEIQPKIPVYVQKNSKVDTHVNVNTLNPNMMINEKGKPPTNILETFGTCHKTTGYHDKFEFSVALYKRGLKFNLSRILKPKIICQNVKNAEAIITLFTTMYFTSHKLFIYQNTIRLWAQLQPYLQPVLFLTPSLDETGRDDLVREACDAGWTVVIAPTCNEYSYPVLRDMFMNAYLIHQTRYYGYANGDILFDHSLIYALQFLSYNYGKMPDPGMLLAGRRYDVKLHDNTTIERLLEIRNHVDITDKHGVWGIDYFISTAAGFPWHKIKPFVIGRPKFDNWIIWYAETTAAIAAVDATDAILAVHQSSNTSYTWSASNTDRGLSYNTKVVYGDKKFHTLLGGTHCMSYKLVGNALGSFVLNKVDIRKSGRISKGICEAQNATVVF